MDMPLAMAAMSFRIGIRIQYSGRDGLVAEARSERGSRRGGLWSFAGCNGRASAQGRNRWLVERASRDVIQSRVSRWGPRRARCWPAGVTNLGPRVSLASALLDRPFFQEHNPSRVGSHKIKVVEGIRKQVWKAPSG